LFSNKWYLSKFNGRKAFLVDERKLVSLQVRMNGCQKTKKGFYSKEFPSIFLFVVSIRVGTLEKLTVKECEREKGLEVSQ
jgi:hypothetical protein